MNPCKPRRICGSGSSGVWLLSTMMTIRMGSPGCAPSCAAVPADPAHNNANAATATNVFPIGERIDLRGLYVKVSVFRRPLDVIDHEHLDWHLLALQPEPELLLHCGEN